MGWLFEAIASLKSIWLLQVDFFVFQKPQSGFFFIRCELPIASCLKQ